MNEDNLKKYINPKIIEEDSKEIEKFVIKTPLIRLNWLDTPNRKVWAKLECNQITNSFKVRGAYNAIRKIDSKIPILTNSAGNHGLAVAYTLQKLKRKGTIFVPENASELKLRRLINMGANVNPIGKDLYNCGEIAKNNAKKIGGKYISPYSTTDVIVGQASLAVEILKQKERFDNILIPLGGGGLLLGTSIYFKYKNPDCKIHAIHPKIFNRDFSNKQTDVLSKPIYPTIADGLAVQHSNEDKEISAYINEITDSIDQISEKNIEIGIVSMLTNEGILIEGASATGIAALLNDPNGEKYNGDVLVIISGGNISSSSLMHAMATSTNNMKIGKMLGFNSTTLPQESIKYKNTLLEKSETVEEEYINEIDFIWDSIIQNVYIDLTKLKGELQELIEYSQYEHLDLNKNIVMCIFKDIKDLEEIINITKKEKNISTKRDFVRIAIQKYSYLRNSLSWCSASSAQSKKIMFFDPAENNDNSCNYDRYGTLLLKEREVKLQESLGFDPENTGLLLTSSGQAAYTVIESFLLREVLSKNPKIVSCPYIYFENLEQIQSLKNIDFIVSNTWNIENLITLVEENNAEALFVDPLANLGSLHTIDFVKFEKLLEGHDWSNKWLIVDGTMVSGGINLFDIFKRPNDPHIIYMESGSKYLQFGLDLQMAGVVVSSKEYLPQLNIHRRNTGTIMYQSGITKFPGYNRKVFLSRMSRLTKNAEILCNTLNILNKDKKRINITFPTNWRDLGWKHGGGVVAINFVENGINNKPCLDFLIDLIIEESKKKEIAFTKGVSFGFSTIRISAAAAMAQNRSPFLRFSIGEETNEEMAEICKIIEKCFKIFFEKYNI